MMDKPILYIVVPCYNEQEALPETNKQLQALLDEMERDELVSSQSKIMYVNDGSRDNTWQLIESYAQEPQHKVCGVKLAANAGHQNALMAGLETAKQKADIMVSIDADLQDDIRAIPQMVKEYNNGCDIVYGVRRERKTDTWFKRTTALGFYKLMHALGVKSVYNHADYRLMSKRAVEQLCSYGERNLFLRGIVAQLGYKTAQVFYDRSERIAGESKYPLSKMLNLATDGITSFSIKPLRCITMLGAIFMLIALGILIYVIYSMVKGSTVPGWTSLILSIWFVGGVILVCMGVVGEYIGKIYMETKGRPRYNIEKVLE